MEKETLVALTADIAAAHTMNNKVAITDMPALINSIYNALSGVVESTQTKEVRPEPAVSIRSSVKPNAITCLECGVKMKLLKPHIKRDHNMTPETYKARWELPVDYPLVAPNYTAMRRNLAAKIGLGRKPSTKRGRASPKKAAAK